METLTADIQFGLGGGAFSTGFSSGFGGGGWTSIFNVIREGTRPVLQYGITGATAADRIADPSVFSFVLDNSGAHGSPLGFYSPLNAIKRGGFDFNIPVRLLFTYGGYTVYKFFGSLGNIQVEPGKTGTRGVRCTAVDLMDDYMRIPAPPLDVQFDKRGDELIQLLLNTLPVALQPALRMIETGLETHAVAFDTLREESMTMREALNQVCLTDLGRLLPIGTTEEPGGLWVYRNRHYAALDTTVKATLTDADIINLVVPGSRDDLVSTVQVTVHTTRRDTGANTVLYALQTTSTLVNAGQTNDSIFGPYRDPDTSSVAERVGGTDMVQPVSGTDFQMNTASDGSGGDLTAQFTVTAAYTGAGVRFTITNRGSVPGYVTKLQCRGNGIYRYPTVLQRSVDTKYGQRVMQIDMPFETDVNVGEAVADYLVSTVSKPLARATSVTFLANKSPALMTAALLLEPNDRFSITETVTGLAGQEFIIDSVRLELQSTKAGPLLWCTWFPEPADTTRYWFDAVPGAAELSVSTVLGF